MNVGTVSRGDLIYAKAATVFDKLISLREDLASGTAGRVDRVQGIIYGVKVLGANSKNSHKIPGAARTTYTFEAMRKAVKFYEHLQVNVDHTDRSNPERERSARDRIGWLSNPRVTEDGIFADLNLSKTDPFSEKVFEAAERNPSLFSLSHNAMGRWELQGDTAVIVEITEVRSVDIVADGGSVSSLFESKQKLKEGSPMPMEDLPVAAPAAADSAPDPMDALADLMGAFLKTKSPEHYEIAKKILAMVKPEAAIATAEEEEEMPAKKSDKPSDTYEADEDEDEEKKMKESAELETVKAELNLLKRKTAILAEAKELRVELNESTEAVLMKLEDPADRKVFLEEVRQKRTFSNYAKSIGPIPTTTNNDTDFEKTYASTMQRLTGRSVKR